MEDLASAQANLADWGRRGRGGPRGGGGRGGKDGMDKRKGKDKKDEEKGKVKKDKVRISILLLGVILK